MPSSSQLALESALDRAFWALLKAMNAASATGRETGIESDLLDMLSTISGHTTALARGPAAPQLRAPSRVQLVH